MWLCRWREEPWVPNVRCQVCIFRPWWDEDDYHGNYSAFEQSVGCVKHWEAHLPRDLMPVFVCHHKQWRVSRGCGRRRGGEAGWGKEEVPCLQFSCGKLGGGIRVAVHCSQFPLLTLCSYPWFLLALKRLAWKWSRYQSSLSPRWGRAGSGPGFLLFMAFSLSFLFSHNALCLFLCTLYIPRPALWFNMHDKFYSYVHTHYLLDWAPPHPSLTRSTDREMPRRMNGSRVRRPPPSWLSLTLQLQRDPSSYTDTHLLLIIILRHHSLMSVSAPLYSAEHTDMAQFPLGCLLTQHTSHSTAVLHMDTH